MSEDRTFFEMAERLDVLIALDTITQEQVEEVAALITREPLERYFFRHLAATENSAWFEPLEELGLLDTPPEPVVQGNVTSYPPWPAMSYLVSIAPKCPERVIRVAGRISARSPFEMLGLVEAAQTMPPSHAAAMVPIITRWADEGLRIEMSVVSLAIYLAQNDEWESALAALDLILSPSYEPVSEEMKRSPFFSPRASSRAEEYVVRTFVEQDLALFLDHQPLATLATIQRNLEKALEIERLAERDASWAWRPAIEPHEQNLEHSEIKNTLVTAAERALRAAARTMPVQARPVVEEFLAHRSSIFRRLAIHTVRLNTSLWPSLWERLFTDPDFLGDVDIHHEYWLLIHETYKLLPTCMSERFVARILATLPTEGIQGRKEYDAQRYLVLKQLRAIDDSLLAPQHRETLQELVADYGEPDYPSFLSYGYTGVGWVSSKSPTDLDQLSAEEIVSELRKTLPFDSLDEPSHEGLARALKGAISANPERMAPMALDLFAPDIPPIHTYYALWGFRDAWNAGRKFDWAPVLTLCDAVSHTIENVDAHGAPPDTEPGYWDRTYANARTSVADLLQAGVARDDHAIPQEQLEQVRNILLALVDDPNPTPEYEARWSKGYPRRVLDFALNVTRGRAVEALIQYALHFARLNAQQQSEGRESQARQPRMEGAVRDKLTVKLDKQVDPSLAVHSLFGKYLPNLHYLDQTWLVAHLEDIFPRRSDMTAYWEAAWEGYLFRSDFFGYLYESLKPYYRYALGQMALDEQGKAGSELAQGRLARHFAALYWRGVEALETEESLLPVFFDVAPDQLRATFVRGIEAGLESVKPDADSEEWQRAKALWIARVQAMTEAAEKKGNLERFLQEVGAYTGWVPYVPSGEFEDLFPLIEVSVRFCDSHQVHEVIEFLPSTLDEHARLAMRLLEGIVEQSAERWFMASEHEAVRSILEAAMGSGDEEVVGSAVRVINRFGERGDERYRLLLERR